MSAEDRCGERNGVGRGKEVELKKSPLSTPLKELLRKKKVGSASGVEKRELVLNDYDLDANEILSWLRGDTDQLELNGKREKACSSSSCEVSSLCAQKEKREYRIRVDKESVNPSKKQLCETCYERLASVSSESVCVSLPESIQKCIVRGSVVGVERRGKVILYLCNDYYVDYNVSLQCASLLASSYSLPLVVVLLRPEDEYRYPFSPHSARLLLHLSRFRRQLVSLHITPLLLFTSSYASSILALASSLSPLFIVTETPPSLPYQYALSCVLKENPHIASSLLLLSNTPSPCSFSLSDSVLCPSATLAQLTAHYRAELASESPCRSPQPLAVSTQLKVAYSLSSEDSLPLSESVDFAQCELVLPPFLTASPPHAQTPSHPSDFCYEVERSPRQRVANWGDIEHEVRWMDRCGCWSASLEACLGREGWCEYYRGSSRASSVYRVVERVRGRFVSVYSVCDVCKERGDGLSELAEVVAMDAYYHSFLASRLSESESWA